MRRRILALSIVLFATARPVFAQDHEDSKWLIAALTAQVTAQGADLGSTMYALGECHRAPTCRVREANPAARWAVKKDPALAGAVKMGIAAGVTLLLYKLHVDKPRLVEVTATALAVGFSSIAYHNSQVLRR